MTSSEPNKTIALEQRAEDGGRLFSPSAARNRAAIADVLDVVLPRNARVLEIGSGTGEHAVAACEQRTDIFWQPSDPDESSRASQAAWADAAQGRIAPPLALDLTQDDWWDGVPACDALVCMNVIHISPWKVAQNLAAGGAALLQPGQRVFLYGPYKEGRKTAPSNLDFDASLQSRNPDWGVRELDSVIALFEAAGFVLERRIDMPANNLSLVFEKAGSV
ncbi:DUF938 domain-containing protein [Maricaulis parjimensis]|uniref:DUF938 domain-containing protein n=1 Tax=Maricaulis parjimensis TaxID=144023 RepID=UPI001939B1DC|nr:DUF938 domain-containing protein [Maricaulis parjimensis]